jgi:hypothetical protein
MLAWELHWTEDVAESEIPDPDPLSFVNMSVYISE